MKYNINQYDYDIIRNTMRSLELNIDKVMVDTFCHEEQNVNLSFRVGNTLYQDMFSTDCGELLVNSTYTDEDGEIYEEENDFFGLPLSEKIIIYNQLF